MFEIVGNSIHITKGDTGHISISLLETGTGSPHVLKAGDTFILTVMDNNWESGQVLIYGTDNANSVYYRVKNNGEKEVTLMITAAQSRQLPVGQYTCDIQYQSGNEVYTIFPVFSLNGDSRKMSGEQKAWKNFWVLPEVTTQFST